MSPVSPDGPAGPIEVWAIPCDGPTDPGACGILSKAEQERANAFLFPEHRRRFIQSHVGLRQLLTRYIGLSADALRFGNQGGGKPFLENAGATGIHFNLSHSGELAVVAIAAGREVGIDVERIRPTVDWRDIARNLFHPAETEWILKATEPLSAFFYVWTAKEAYLKAMGRGLGQDLGSFSVIGPDAQQELVLTRLDLPREYIAVVAYPPPASGVCQRWWRGSEGAGLRSL